jgi:uncharacterized membrane protein YidH (DUF202 family)
MTPGATKWLQRPYALLGATFGTVAVVTQFFASTPLFMAQGMSAPGAIVQVLSFFTILCNIGVVVFYLATLRQPRSKLWRMLQSPKLQSAMALYISIVACVYIAVLQDIWEPQGIFKLLDFALHYVTPALFIIHWLAFIPKGETTYADAARWLLPGLIYVVYALLRGSLTGLYPYPFLNAGALGDAIVIRNIAFLLIFFFMLALVLIAIDNWLGRANQTR